MILGYFLNSAAALSQAQRHLTWWQFKGHTAFSVFFFFLLIEVRAILVRWMPIAIGLV